MAKSTQSKKVPAYIKASGLKSFVTLAQFHNVTVDAGQMAHALGLGQEPATTADILRAAKEVKLKARALKSVSYEKLPKTPLPAIVKLETGEYVLLAKADETQVLVLSSRKQAPETMPRDEFEKRWTGEMILCTQRFSAGGPSKFGIKWFIPSIIKYKKPLLEVLAAAFSLQILGLFAPILTQVIIDKALTHQGFSTLDVLIFALVAVAIFELLMELAKGFIFTHTTSRIDVTLGAKLFRHLFSLPLRYFETRRVGDTIARVRELETIRNFLTGAPLTSILDVLFIVVYIAIMLWYSTSMTWIVLATFPLFIILSAIVTPLFRRRLDEKFDTGAESQAFLVESVTGSQTIKSFALEPTNQKRWEDILAKYVKATFKTAWLGTTASSSAQFIQKIADLGILWLGAHLVIQGDLTIGALVAFRMLSSRVSGPVLRLVQLWQDIQQAGISIKRLADIFNTKPERMLDATKTRLPSVKGDMSFEGVRFRYRPDAGEVIRDMSFDIKAGSTVGVVGRSGSGKSTIAKLMQRLYVPEAGHIRVDGVDIATADPFWLRRQIGVVLQENFLFNMSVRDNIAIHMPSASMERVIEAAKVAGAHEFILELPEGYDTVVGERGEALSGGQRQRLAIARALLHDPRIVIFDEATSALDYESEALIQKNLKAICKGRTVIIIAHRLSTLKDADYIMSVDKGEVAEYGPRTKLAKGKGLYAKLLAEQAKGEV